MSDAVHITNLLYRYAELMDLGDLTGVAGLFAHATIKMGGGTTLHGADAMLALWRANVKLHPCGTPRTKHVITNPIVEIDDGGERATCRSYYTVLQAAPGVPLQVIGAGRYHDGFEKVDGTWRFATRDYSMFDLHGDLTQHLLIQPPAQS
ncbi:nuclear transport factor 2 family protein [Sphingomonas jatrophae]|uniref:SnoaL-like domain-containing protein n=1 Tax=Sphingomonas jatrophae TaxID=1166337 RepID=A0A1I6KLH3_9SPHN|nr:nuclear transport factor 2 family protein [Sphingomonas jatrophae]SFR92061.1 SnoaL-like domain-containing protein [Sphingomonas jatrophae]